MLPTGDHIMLKSITGVYRHGQIILIEQPSDLPDEIQVIVTFLTPQGIDLTAKGINVSQAADLRARLHSFAEEWESPEMDVYDDYTAAKAAL
jgi:hypothetical protein